MWKFSGRVITGIIDGKVQFSRLEINERDGKCLGVRLVRE